MQVVRSNSELIFERFKESLSELIQSYAAGAPVIDEQLRDNIELEVTSIVGLSSADVSATVSISTTRRAALSLSHFPLASAEDWIGELSNQLAGRLKNKLCMYGLNLNLSTPTTVRGNQLHISSSALESFIVSATLPDGDAIVQLSLNIEPSLELHEQEAEGTSEEGSLELF